MAENNFLNDLHFSNHGVNNQSIEPKNEEPYKINWKVIILWFLFILVQVALATY